MTHINKNALGHSQYNHGCERRRLKGRSEAHLQLMTSGAAPLKRKASGKATSAAHQEVSSIVQYGAGDMFMSTAKD